MREVVRREINDQINLSRSEKAEGNSFYRFSDILNPNLFSKKYTYPAVPPPMVWKDSIKPLPTKNLIVERGNIYSKIKWLPPEKSLDGDSAKFYNIYRSNTQDVNSEDPVNLISTVGRKINEYIDSSGTNIGRQYYFVSSLDKTLNESVLCSEFGPIAENITSAKDKQTIKAEEPKKILESQVALFINTLFKPKAYLTVYPQIFDKYSLIGYEINGTYFVNITLYDSRGREIKNLLKGTQSPGKYIIKLSGKNLNSGEYTCRLRFGNITTDKILVKQ
jgi:hypothetical protein